ncbi:branched-chain amino acid ABC transporter permease [Nitratireductor sp. CAU 1489]|uniref:Branched-chain amino acid ABC transporter permease n=1 Tax=Nitratireductor arenosus TaxID=2682096 RepID=A0A844QHE4_9HYPH|nr:branched-chain amino acid ABC transporter permease [Nitratireductor arenosus]MVA98577.1 branched-chain amino acid ABC transporter permease [Nitratireductor arenosus]
MDFTIALFLIQDGIINGAIYALLAVALVLVFAVTRVILIPQGEFVTFAGLSLAAMETGGVPGAVWLLLVLATGAAVMDAGVALRERSPVKAARLAMWNLAPAIAIAAAVLILVPLKLGLAVNVVLCAALIVPMGPYLYRVAFQPLADASVLVLLIASVGAHLALTALGLVLFGAEGYRTSPVVSGSFQIGPLFVTGQSLLVVGATLALLAGLALFFGRTLIGKALKASAINRRGARLVGIPTMLSGRIAFAMAAAIGVVSAVLVAPLTTLYYDSGFIIGLKGFVAAIIGGLGAYPAAVAAALAVGLLEAFSSFWASAFKEVIVFASILPVLLWRSLTSTHSDEED